jgi:sugar lactone lactonase YvrE
MQAARSSLASDDAAGARRHLLAADSLIGGHTGAKWTLATIAAHEGDREDMLHWLGALADAGITRPVAADSLFHRWRADPEFRAVAGKLEANGRPSANATIARSLGDADLLAEDVAWDARGKRFLVSSIHRGKILAIDDAGHVTDFAGSRDAGVWGVYGLALDAKRGVLWATTGAGPEFEDFLPADSGRTALLAFDLRTSRLRQRLELARTAARQVLGDVTVASDGTVYACESYGGAVYRLPHGAAALETLVPAGRFRSPQLPAMSRDGRRIFVPDYSRGIASVTLSTGAVDWMPKPYSLASGGIDGLYRDGDRLIAVQNGTTPHRLVELRMDAAEGSITNWRVLEQASDRLGEPNHGVLVGRDFFFIGDSGWDRVGEDGKLQTAPDSKAPVLYKLALDRQDERGREP